jgi:hypothetical protein
MSISDFALISGLFGASALAGGASLGAPEAQFRAMDRFARRFARCSGRPDFVPLSPA